MARGVNKVILVGNIGQDPEMKYMPSGNAVTNISVATSESWKDKETGQQQERTEWHRVVFFNRLAEIAGEYLRKGSKVYVEGQLRTRKWQDQSGQDRYTTEIVASEMQMLDGRNESDGQSYAQPQPQPQQQQQAARPTAQNNAYAAATQGSARQQPRQQPQQQGQQAYTPHPHAGYAGVPDDARAQMMAQQPPQNFDKFDDDIPF